MSSFWLELKRRNVVRVAIAYAVVAWLLIEIASTTFPILSLPQWTVTLITVVILIGFPLAIIFTWAFELTPSGVRRDSSVFRTDRHQRSKLHIGITLAVAVVALALVAFAGIRFSLDGSTDGRHEPNVAVEFELPVRLAVLPFVNLSDVDDNEYFSDGLTEEILNLLTRVPDLRVASRTTSFAYKGRAIDVPSIAEQLGVSIIVEGSVRRSENRVRITAHIVNSVSDSRIWSDNYDAEIEDIFSVQEDIARKIVQALSITLSPSESDSLRASRSSSVVAYDYYLRGRSYLEMSTKDGYLDARTMFQRAIEVDSNYAPAYAWLAIFHAVYYQLFEKSQEHLTSSDRLSRRAVELAPDLEFSHVSRGLALSAARKYEEAETSFEIALATNPRSPSVHLFYGATTFKQGQYERTATLWENALVLDPNHKQVLSLLPQVYRSLGRREDQLRVSRRAAEVIENSLALNPDDAIEALRLASIKLAIGERESALQLADRTLNLIKDDANLLYNAACLYALAGNADLAIRTIESAVKAGFSDVEWMSKDSDLDAIREHPRFIELVAQLGGD